MGHQQARQVSDAFRQDLFAVDTEVSERAVRIHLCHQSLRGRVVLSPVLSCPPNYEAALSVIDIAKFIEAMADLVGHAGAGGSVVGGGVALAVEIRRLQNGGGEELDVRAKH